MVARAWEDYIAPSDAARMERGGWPNQPACGRSTGAGERRRRGGRRLRQDDTSVRPATYPSGTTPALISAAGGASAAAEAMAAAVGAAGTENTRWVRSVGSAILPTADVRL